jgi:acyl carrier protein phosphodiesterase
VNYLAHLYLAGRDPHAQVGALLGDFAKGDLARFDPVIEREIRLHRAVDAWTDAHPVVLAAKARFRPHARRFAGIVLDVYYDHVLAREWARWSDEPLAAFAQRFYAALQATPLALPPRLERLRPWLVAEDWLGSYADFEGFARAVRRLSTRLSQGAERMIDGIDDVRRHDAGFAAGFAAFFPELVAFAGAERARLDSRR